MIKYLFVVFFNFFVVNAFAQNVLFEDLLDSAQGLCLDPSTSVVNGNTLLVNQHLGRTPSLLSRNCYTSTGSGAYRQLHDTLSANIVAPPGYYISKVIFRQTPQFISGQYGVNFLQISTVVAGVPRVLNASVATEISLPVGQYTEVPFSYGLTLLSYKTGSTISTTSVSVSNVQVEAVIAPF
jgi:hypothetical protein